jgi:hypothetical protein
MGGERDYLRPRRKIEDLRYGNMDDLPAQRARQFANMIQAMLRDFLPPGREWARLVNDHLVKIAYENNLAIINVPPECDELDKRQIERREIEARMGPLTSMPRSPDA